VFVTGCSAGSYGSIMWSAHAAHEYPNARIYQFGDSGAGVVTDTFFHDSFGNWNAEPVFPYWIDALDPAKTSIEDKQMADLYIGIANAYPNSVFSQYNTRFDNNQILFYTLMGGDSEPSVWSNQMLTSIDQINSAAPNFKSYTAAGDQHCIIVYDNFYTRETDGVKLTDWLSDMLDDQDVPDVQCADCTVQQ